MTLKAMQITAFPVTDKTYRKTDEKGLYLEIRPNGSKLWFLKYRIAGKEKRLGLGAWPEVGLADARDRRDDARRMVQAGTDPLIARKLDKIASQVSAANSFQSVAEEFIAVKLVANGKAQSTVEKARLVSLASVRPDWIAANFRNRSYRSAGGAEKGGAQRPSRNCQEDLQLRQPGV